MRQKSEVVEPHSDIDNSNLECERKNILSSIINKSFSYIFPSKQKTTLKESLEEILDEREENQTPSQIGETSILRNVLEFNELYVEDIMIPRADIFAIDIDTSIDDVKSHLLEKIYTRIPVYREDLDEIKGFIHIKDLAKQSFTGENFDFDKILRKCLFVPASMKISNLLIRMQQNRVHIAIVVDEYGGTEGLVTLEDIIEEIVGNIEDEHDFEEKSLDPVFKVVRRGEFEISSRVKIEEVEEKTGITLQNAEEESEYDTIGGLIFSLTSRIPVEGEIIQIADNLECEILEADARTLKKILLRKK